ncbi:hypothetical protein [Desulfonema magnum]|uniref:Uncharacterized protein n=1 Tax=Desulfonema magnum TaxID=45655 RepID=A0A975GLY4_9BACT|nr:hypothetical protein [Desulfonema magnum]QTA86336.1 Uncharacterized protein dnm_023580 [Desulfonema magnum]
MKKIQRRPAPAWFKDHGEWGELSSGDRNKLLSELVRMTRHHCSFCDENLLGKEFSLIQFRPRIKFYLVSTRSVGMSSGRFASYDRRIPDAKRPRCVPTRSVGTRSKRYGHAAPPSHCQYTLASTGEPTASMER